MELSTDWKKVCEVSTKLSSNLTGYTRLYMKYGNRSGLNDTIYYEIRQFAYNPYGTYFAWQWDTAIAWSIKSGSITRANNSFTQPAIYSYKTDSTANEVVRASGSYVQPHNSDGTFSETLTFTAPIYNSTYTTTGSISLPTIITKPTLTVTNNSRKFTTSGVLINFTVGNTGGASTKSQYSINNSSWTTFDTRSSNGSGTYTLPSSLLSSFPKTYTATVYFRATNSNGTSTTQTLSIPIDNTSVKPTISTFTITPDNGSYASTIGSAWVKNLSKAKLKIVASAGTGANSVKINLTKLTAYSSFSAISNLTLNSSNEYTYPNYINVSGSGKIATIQVTDSRGNDSLVTQDTSTFYVIDYFNPSISSLNAQRCTSNGTLSDTGTYCKLTINYSVAPINNSGTNKNTKTLEYKIGNGSWTSISISAYSGTVTPVVGGSLATNTSYQIQVRLTDVAHSVSSNITLPTSFVLVSKRAGGKGIAFGKIAESDNFECALPIIDRNGHKVNEFNGRNSNMDYTKTSSEYGTKRTDIVYSGSTSRPNTDGFIETYFWDNSGTYDTQVFFPNNGTATPKYRSKGGGSSWGNWQSLGKKELVCARLSSHTNITISSTYTDYKVALSNTSYIATNTYELTSDGGIKIKVAGTYLINANIVLYASVITDLISMITRKKASDSSTVQVFCGYTRGDVANTWHTLSFSEFPLTVEANDIIYLNVQTSNTCTVKVAGTNSRFTYMTIKEI